ncbi:MAG: lipid-A-disaccharide synthase N-terminal domain-containing protein [Syntrophobacteraceae bacterium]|nr:lipid-A-disaccharide synthase N-terminal domain-containing protein [Syntrophobacteraceae bacterium]
MEMFWVALGFAAQGLFSARFLVQWIVSERAGRSVVPLAFWILSLVGGALLTLYAVYRKDPVFIVGQAGGLVVYSRNLYLIYRERSRQAPAPTEGPPPVEAQDPFR